MKTTQKRKNTGEVLGRRSEKHRGGMDGGGEVLGFLLTLPVRHLTSDLPSRCVISSVFTNNFYKGVDENGDEIELKGEIGKR